MKSRLKLHFKKQIDSRMKNEEEQVSDKFEEMLQENVREEATWH